MCSAFIISIIPGTRKVCTADVLSNNRFKCKAQYIKITSGTKHFILLFYSLRFLTVLHYNSLKTAAKNTHLNLRIRQQMNILNVKGFYREAVGYLPQHPHEDSDKKADHQMIIFS